MKKFILNNRTHWSSRDLRQFVYFGLQDKGVIDQADNQQWTIVIMYGRSRGDITGVAWPRLYKIQLNIPKATIPMVRLGQVFEHEIDHMLGLNHRDMAPHFELEVPWVEGEVIRRATAQRKPARQECSKKKENRCRVLLTTWERKLKQAERKVRKYRGKVRYYDKKNEVTP